MRWITKDGMQFLANDLVCQVCKKTRETEDEYCIHVMDIDGNIECIVKKGTNDKPEDNK